MRLGHLALPRKEWALGLIPVIHHGKHVWSVNTLHLLILISPGLSGNSPSSLELHHQHNRIPDIL